MNQRRSTPNRFNQSRADAAFRNKAVDNLEFGRRNGEVGIKKSDFGKYQSALRHFCSHPKARTPHSATRITQPKPGALH